MIYFVQAGSRSGPIKIGCSRRGLAERLYGIQRMCPIPLVCLAITPGHREQEKRFHRRFAASRLHGEWFTPTPKLEALIVRLAETSGEFAGHDLSQRAAKKRRGYTAMDWLARRFEMVAANDGRPAVEQLRSMLVRRGDQRALAMKAKTSVSRVSRILSGHSTPSLQLALRIKKATGIKPEAWAK